MAPVTMAVPWPSLSSGALGGSLEVDAAGAGSAGLGAAAGAGGAGGAPSSGSARHGCLRARSWAAEMPAGWAAGAGVLLLNAARLLHDGESIVARGAALGTHGRGGGVNLGRAARLRRAGALRLGVRLLGA